MTTQLIVTIVRRLGQPMVLVLLAAGQALAADRFVATTGSDTANDCLSSASPCRSISVAVSQAASGDVVKVASGVYRENLLVDASTTLVIEGGWAADFATRDPALNVTKVDGRRIGRVVDVAAGAGEAIDLTLDGLTLTRGSGTGAGVRAATSGDGALTVAVVDCLFQGNWATGVYGGGIFASSSAPGSLQLTVTDSVFRQNRAGIGAGIYVEGVVNLAVTDSLLERNRSISVGGAVRAMPNGGALTFTGCTLDRNKGANGGGMDVLSSGTSSLTITGSSLTRNRASLGGSGALLKVLDGTLTVTATNVVVRGNRARRHPGCAIVATLDTGTLDLSLTNATLVHNGGGGLQLVTFGGTLVAALRNTVIWDNAAGFDGDLLLTEGSGSLTVDADHDIIGVRIGDLGTVNDLGGNLSVDPLLVSRSDVHLTAGSPAIDAGTCTGAPATDFEGDPRPTGSGCDIGADEFVP